ncbi:MAG: hypothetical protein A2252_01480 [Elusimicrobia bacterium RIFOXYA2_FULL_39_19]|nr:MAG: hypothetical protein A2252_01480 [Elusimicrobia bacterium RIFOXYA2_FULL_39_19]
MKKKYIEIALVTVISIFVVIFVINWSIKALIHNRTDVIVPKIEGRSLQEAIDIVSLLGLGVIKDGEEYNAKLPPGTVIRQLPYPGMTVREGKIIRITLSKGSDLVFVPEIIGQTTKIAELLVRKNMMTLEVKNEQYSLRFEKNKIISQNPSPDSVVDKNGVISVTVSLGVPPEGMLLMPEFVGQDINEFKKWSEKNKITFQVREEEFESSPYNIVVSQEPQADTVLTYETQVVVVVSKGSTSILSTQPQQTGDVFHYDVPQGAKEQKIQVMLIDSTGEHQIYSSVQQPGSKIDIPVMKKGKSKLRVFINNILVEEKEL